MVKIKTVSFEEKTRLLMAIVPGRTASQAIQMLNQHEVAEQERKNRFVPVGFEPTCRQFTPAAEK